ncbi:Clp protease N-terminal domain-containing protein [Leifsonia sp. YIM 134122]|uniref:Clp protease N-terminal domain-containing protein n=1 Tax=Leifsonia stereocauli TaxID=3134136 RepID=A0ABU9VZ19_9MICO
MTLRTARSDIAFMSSLFTAAEEEAHKLGDDVMGPEHLVVAVLDLDDIHRSDLNRLGLDADSFRRAIASVHADALATSGVYGSPASIEGGPSGPLRSTQGAQQVFRDARKRAKAKRAPLTAAGILASAARPEHGTTARALAHLGIDRAAVEALDQ